MIMIDEIKKLQTRVGAMPDGVIGPKTITDINRALEGAKPSVRPPQAVRRITSIAVHCSATPEGKHYTAADIDRWHRAQGWAGIGYNAVVLLDGTIQEGRDESLVPSHASGHNQNSIAICYIGGTDAHGRPKDTRTEQQKASLLYWLSAKRAQYPEAVIQGHCDYPGVKKACPSFPAKKEYAAI